MDAGLLDAREPYDQDMTVIEDIIESIQNPLGGALARTPVGALRLFGPGSLSCCCRIPVG